MGAFLDELKILTENQNNKKIKKALELFSQCDDDMKMVVLYSSGLKGVVTPESIQELFDTLDLMDMLDSAIEDMEFDIETS